MKPEFFQTQTDFRRWLEENHAKQTELIVGFYKVGTGKSCMSWSEAVDQALYFGWIDGIGRKIVEESYSNRFTPRKKNSNWSAVNIAKVAKLTQKGLMKPAGIAAFEKREEKRSRVYVYENKAKQFSGEFEKQFKSNKKAWEFFQNQANWYKKQMTSWVMSAKQEATQERRFAKLITDSEKGKRV